LFSLFTRQSREWIEQYTGCSLGEKTIIAEFDRIPSNGIIELPYGPVKSISSVKVVYEDTGETSETLALNDDYYVTKSPWSELRVAYLSIYSRSTLQVQYIVGYGATGCPPLPIALKVAMMKDILDQYDNRENFVTGTVLRELSNNSKELAAPYRRNPWFGPEY
jgi:uncharacterized phiE125 gp8 family phage protein